MAKKLHRFFVNKNEIKRRRFVITDKALANHIHSVLRLSKGDRIELFDGTGVVYVGLIGFLTKEQISGVIEEEIITEKSNKPAIFLAQALPKAGKLARIIRMNTEIGVDGFILFESEYSQCRKEAMTEDRVDRLNRVAIEAVGQSRGLILPEIYGPMSFAETFEFKADHKYILHTDSKGMNIMEAKKEIKPEDTVIIYIGAEGGFSPKEILKAKQNDAKFIYIDLPILRTETAGVVASSILRA